MPVIRFLKNKPPIEIPKRANLMQSLLSAGLPVASSCGGKGICSKCRIQIVEGADHLSAESKLERELKAQNKVEPGYRISCQTAVVGDITIDTSYW